jgi:ABC-type multidrug transport system fused ATPase/permease subunit
MKSIKRIYASIFKWVPGSALFAVCRRIYDGFVPVMVTLISVALFDSAANVLSGDKDFTSLYLYAGLYLLVYLINDLLGFASSIIVQCWVYEKCTAFFRMELYEKFAKLPLIALENADVLNRKERVDKAVNNEELSSTFQRTQAIIQNAVAVIGVAIVLARYSLWLLPLSLLSVLPYLFARIIRGKEFFHVKQAQAKKTRLQSYLWSLFTTRQTAKEMRVMGFDSYITDKWRDTRDDVNEELWTVQKRDAVSLLWCDGIRIAGYCISIAVVLWLVVRGDVTLGVFGGAITAFLSLQNNTKNFLSDIGRLTEHLSHAADYYNFLDMSEDADGAMVYSGMAESITLDNISFKYPNSENYALKPLNLTIRKGEKIAILGENGSGKTTLSKILLGLYPPENGQVLYDGKPVDDFTKDSFYSGVSAIAQDFVSYNLTMRENVAISDLSRLHDDSDIRTALTDAGVDENIDLDDAMGREFGGKELSGGQWQKLAIARGLFKNSELIVLDEPTSALDPLIETEILTKFIKAAENKTALIISHRVGLCRMVDRIIVMKEGEIAEDGTHDILLAAGGEYTKLYEAQAKWYS